MLYLSRLTQSTIAEDCNMLLYLNESDIAISENVQKENCGYFFEQIAAEVPTFQS